MIFDYSIGNFVFSTYKSKYRKSGLLGDNIPRNKYVNYLHLFSEEAMTKEEFLKQHRMTYEQFGNLDEKVKEAEEGFNWLLDNNFIEEV